MEPIYDSSYAGRELTTFVQNLRLPRHRWYEFKEGFSQRLVEEAISGLASRKRKLRILDPFAGSGTTLVTAGTLGYCATGIEVNPFLAFTARAKCVPGGWREQSFREILERVLLESTNEMRSSLEDHSTFTEAEGITKWLFNRSVLRGYTAIDHALGRRRKYRDPLRLSLMAALLECCNAKRDGKCLRYRKGWETAGLSSANLREAFQRRAAIVLEDAGESTFNSTGIELLRGDARVKLKELRDRSFDLVVTSPPYLNSFDYSDVYRPELFAGGFVTSNAELRKIRLQTIRSHVQVKWQSPSLIVSPMLCPLLNLFNEKRSVLWNHRIPEMVHAYFCDMAEILQESAKKVRKHGEAWIVVSTSAYAGIEIPVDLILADIATRKGWSLKGIYVMRQLRAAGQHWMHLEPGTKPPLRESLLVLKRVC